MPHSECCYSLQRSNSTPRIISIDIDYFHLSSFCYFSLQLHGHSHLWPPFCRVRSTVHRNTPRQWQSLPSSSRRITRNFTRKWAPLPCYIAPPTMSERIRWVTPTYATAWHPWCQVVRRIERDHIYVKLFEGSEEIQGFVSLARYQECILRIGLISIGLFWYYMTLINLELSILRRNLREFQDAPWI